MYKNAVFKLVTSAHANEPCKLLLHLLKYVSGHNVLMLMKLSPN